MRNLILAFPFFGLIGCPTHNLLRDTPVMNTDLVAVEAQHYADLKTHLLPEGLLVEQRRPPGDTLALYRYGIYQADGAFLTGITLAMLAFKYHETKDPEVLAQALKCWDACHLLIEGSGYPGLVARSFGKETLDGPYVYNRDGSGDGMTGWMFGQMYAVKLLNDPDRKARTAADIKAVVKHLKKHDLVIHMDENTPTRYGDFNTPVFGVPIGSYAMPMLALAALAIDLNPGDEDCADFQRYLLSKDYPSQSAYVYGWFPHRTFNLDIYAMNFMVAMEMDKDEGRRKHYWSGIEAFWGRCYDWQTALFGLFYRSFGGGEHGGGIEDSIARLKNLPQHYFRLLDEKSKEKTHVKIVPIEDRPMNGYYWSEDVFTELTTQEGPREDTGWPRLDFLIAYWFGRHIGEYK
jgi:hypothetical protein